MKRHQMQEDITSDLDNVLSFDHFLLSSSPSSVNLYGREQCRLDLIEHGTGRRYPRKPREASCLCTSAMDMTMSATRLAAEGQWLQYIFHHHQCK